MDTLDSAYIELICINDDDGFNIWKVVLESSFGM